MTTIGNQTEEGSGIEKLKPLPHPLQAKEGENGHEGAARNSDNLSEDAHSSFRGSTQSSLAGSSRQ